MSGTESMGVCFQFMNLQFVMLHDQLLFCTFFRFVDIPQVATVACLELFVKDKQSCCASEAVRVPVGMVKHTLCDR
jgi:hypothetical protein